jgi:S-formylglutathione hydrolase FrmB
MTSLRACLGGLTAAIVLLLCHTDRAAAEDLGPLEFHLSFDKSVSDKPFSGRVYVMLTKNNRASLISGVNWFNPEPIFARDVKDWKPGEKLVLNADALGHPNRLDKLPKGNYVVQAVMDFDRGDIHFSAADGNVWGTLPMQALDPAMSGPVAIKLDKVYKATAFQENDRVKYVEIDSKLLTAFHGRPTKLRAAVALPKSFAANPETRYPVIYEVPGFGGDHRAAFGRVRDTDVAGVEMLYVVLDPNCRLGHHVFADSANNGPYGRALTEELIPHIEKTFRGEGRPQARFVTGHSSGGWSSLWLQVAYPDFFGGCWSTAPDPVDFRDFQQINLYDRGVNMFTAPDGKPRPIARNAGRPILFYKAFSDMEVVMGHGGQLLSFEAVFSPRGADGWPRPLWDRKTGAVDPETAKAWEKYDIRLVLERNWQTLGPKLKGKLHVYMGEEDTFYLEGATKLLQESQKKLGSDAVIELFPGKNHGTLVDAALRQRIAREMAERYKTGKER